MKNDYEFDLTEAYKSLAADRHKHFYEPRAISSFARADAEAWLRTKGCSHALWKGERCFSRLASMVPDVDTRELIPGCPKFGASPQELSAEQREALVEIPPFPGGDNGHMHPHYERLFLLGLRDMNEYIANCENNNGASDFYTGCRRALSGVAEYIRKTAAACRAKGMNEQAENCEAVISDPPRTFYQALLLMFFLETCLWYGEDHNLVTPGRMDRTLIAFYERDIKQGILTQEKAFRLLCDFFLQINNICAPGLALSVIVGGPDGEGGYFVNDLTYLVIAARVKTRLVYPTVGLAWTPEVPVELMDFCCRLELEGVGCPAFFNDPVIEKGLALYGVKPEDRAEWMNSTCVEIMPAGCSNVYVASPYFNCSAHLLETVKEAAENMPGDIEEFKQNYYKRLREQVEAAGKGQDAAWQARKTKGLNPLLSCFTKDCLEKGKDFDDDGARYTWVENSFVGTANTADAIYAIDELIYKTGKTDFKTLYAALEADFEGYEELRRLILSLPKYGNDCDGPDAIAAELFTKEAGISRSVTVAGHEYVPGTFCWIKHARLGSMTMATPDGRKKGTAFADGAGSAQGRDLNGPTASVKSTTKWDHTPMIGGLVQNLKFSKDNMSGEKAASYLKALVEAYLLRGGMEIQINITSLEELKDARIHPENHGDLIVRVAGYSDYFVNLTPELQDEVISRKEHSFC
ncbi:MAG: hypothetical protein ILO36_07260 [Abditibacteriota bacterium]|nr:hypothetical protein [Abditibacteriota bacterium]